MDFEAVQESTNRQLDKLTKQAGLTLDGNEASIICLNTRNFALVSHVLAIKLQFSLVDQTPKTNVAAVFVESAKDALLGPKKHADKKARKLSTNELILRTGLSSASIYNWFSLTPFAKNVGGANMGNLARLFGPRQLIVRSVKDKGAIPGSLDALPFNTRGGRKSWATKSPERQLRSLCLKRIAEQLLSIRLMVAELCDEYPMYRVEIEPLLIQAEDRLKEYAIKILDS